MKDEFPKTYLYKRIVHAKLFIDNNYTQTIDVNNISDEACFSKFHFTRLFKKTYGKTPHQYLTFVRIGKAKELLKDGKGVSEVCSAVGFESLSSFSGLFKRIVGITPSVFMETYRQQDIEIKISPLKFIPGCYISNNGWDEK